MPEAKTNDRILTTGDVLNLSEQHSTTGIDASTYCMVEPNPENKTPNFNHSDSPLNLVINTNYSNEMMRLNTATAKSSFITASQFTTDPTFMDSIRVPINPANKANYFPKPVSHFQGVPTSGHILQRIGQFHYNPTSSGTPLVAFVNPTATSVIPHGLKPVFKANSSIPSVDTMNRTVNTSISSAKPNVTPHLPTPVILVRSSSPLSKQGSFPCIMSPTEKSMSFPKSLPQAIFGNESGKFIPVATIVPNNASLVTNSTKTVTSPLSVEPTLSTNKLKYQQQQNGVNNATHCAESKLTSHSPNPSWYPNDHPIVLHHSSSEPMYNSKGFSMSQPLNLALQSVSNRIPCHKNSNFIDMTNKQKYTSINSSQPSHKLFFHSTSASPPIIINSAAYSLPNQHVTLTTPSQFNQPKGFSSNTTFQTDTNDLYSKSCARSYNGCSIDLLNVDSPPSMTTQIPEKNGHDEFPMTLKIDSIFSLADKPATKSALQPVNGEKHVQKIKIKTSTKWVNKDKKTVIVQKSKRKLSKPCRYQPQKSAKTSVKKCLKLKYKRQNTQLEIAHSVWKQKAIAQQKSNIIVSCYANDFRSLHPISEERRKLNTFFKYLGLCPSSSVPSDGTASKNGMHVEQRASANGQGNISKELARCFRCYVVVPLLKLPTSFSVMDTDDPLESFKLQDKCSKECRDEFLNKQHATTGIVPRNGELDSCWKIILQKPTCPHARKKYCRKSKMKASGSLTGSHCRRVGCIGCTTKDLTTHNKMKDFRYTNQYNISETIEKEQTFPYKTQGRKNLCSFNKKLVHKKERDMKKTKFGKTTVPVVRKRKANRSRYNGSKVLKKKVTVDLQNVMGSGDAIESESVDEISPFESSFLEIYDPARIEDSLIFAGKVVKPEPIALPPADISASSERIQRLKEILKEKQKDLELARQLLL